MDDALAHFFLHAADAVFGIDAKGQVRFWNSACEKLFGLSFEEVNGRKCHTVLCGKDINGDDFCDPDCPVYQKAARGLPINDFDILVKDSKGNAVLLNVGGYISNSGRKPQGDIVAFFAMRHVDCQRLLQRLTVKLTNGCSPDKFNLTPRELEILELASKGLKIAAIADHLSISSITVRNHLKNIYPKLNVHSLTEAVGLALRMNFFK